MAYLALNTPPYNSYIFLNLTRVRDKINSLCQLPRSGSWRDSHFFTYPVLFKRHGILSRTHVYLHPCTFPFFHLFTSSPFHFFTSSPSHLFTSSPFPPFHLFLLYHNKLDVHDALWSNARIDRSASSTRFRYQRTITEHMIHTLRLVLGKGVAQA